MKQIAEILKYRFRTIFIENILHHSTDVFEIIRYGYFSSNFPFSLFIPLSEGCSI